MLDKTPIQRLRRRFPAFHHSDRFSLKPRRSVLVIDTPMASVRLLANLPLEEKLQLDSCSEKVSFTIPRHALRGACSARWNAFSQRWRVRTVFCSMVTKSLTSFTATFSVSSIPRSARFQWSSVLNSSSGSPANAWGAPVVCLPPARGGVDPDNLARAIEAYDRRCRTLKSR